MITLLALVGATACTSDPAGSDGGNPGAAARWRDVTIDHREGESPIPRLGQRGPAAGILQEAWRIDGLGGEEPGSTEPAVFLADGALIVVTATGVEGYDASTGEQWWYYREPGWSLAAGVTDGVVVVASEAPDADREPVGSNVATGRLLALDAATGRVLWVQANRWRLGRFGHRLAVADGVVPVLRADLPAEETKAELIGLDVTTGEPAWTTTYERCGRGRLTPPRRSDGSLVVVREDASIVTGESGATGSGERGPRATCPSTRINGFTPSSGERQWVHGWDQPLPPFDVGASVAGGALLLEDLNGADQLIERDGDRHDLGDPDPAVRGLVGDLRIIRQPDSGLTSVVMARSDRRMATSWPRSFRATPAVRDADGALYLLTARHGPLDGPGLIRGNVAGDEAPAQMPFPGGDLRDGYVRWAAVAGGRLILTHSPGTGSADDDGGKGGGDGSGDDGEFRIMAYETTTPADGPVELAGVPYESWPDPCALGLDEVDGVIGEQERRVDGDAEAYREIGLPGDACRYDPPYGHEGFGDYVEVAVRWVAPTPEAAEGLLDGDAVPGPAGVDEVVERDIAGTRVLQARIGRVLVKLTIRPAAVDTDDALTAVADALADY